MKKLYIIRHAKSDWSNLSVSDYDRPLNERGERDAPMMGEILAARGIKPDLILSSPAKRAQTTAKIIANAVGYEDGRIVYQESLYLASPEEIKNVLRSLPSFVESVFIIGHNPGLTLFAENISAKTIDNIPTCGIVEVVFKTDAWKKIGSDCAEFVSLDYPKKHKKMS